MVTMKNKQNLKNLFVEMAGKTTISSPQITDNIGKVVGYWPSYAGKVKTRGRY